MKLADPVSDLPGVRARDLESLASAGISNCGQLLDWFPKRYEDRRRFDVFPFQAGGGPVCLRGMVVDTAHKGFGGKGFYEAVVDDSDKGGLARLTCRWFNMPFLQKVIASGHEVVLFGTPKDSGGRLVMDHPEFEVISGQEKGVHLERIVPIYRNISGIPQRRLREMLFELLEQIDPREISASYEIDATYPRREALREIHFPTEISQAEASRRFFAKEEFFFQQLLVLWRKRQHQALQGRVMGRKTALLKAFYDSLPFDLTNAQKRSVHEIAADMRKPNPMNRLLQGDVGSGKTFVAMCAMLLAVDSGCQAALMAPTQILAEQHYLTFSKWLAPLGLTVGLLTGSRREDLEANILIGTHALLFDRINFDDLGLIIIDEQHKFGVGQRGALIERGVTPDVLVMTATPIPRTLTLTIYGDLEVSVLDELPSGRGSIVTGVRVMAKINDLKRFLVGELEKGRQAYLVYPLVEESESVRAGSVLEEHPKWLKRLGHFEVDLLHGKISSEEKDAVMTRFRNGKSHVLVSTTVIEVGVDVPNANIMVIFNAERFGLAQLHQLRGRIGRGPHKSYCVLVSDGKNSEGIEKLKILAKTNDGFRIAEEDLKLRGPGEVMGVRQSGASELRFVEFLSDPHLIRESREIAGALLDQDPHLEKNPELREWIENQSVIRAS